MDSQALNVSESPDARPHADATSKLELAPISEGEASVTEDSPEFPIGNAGDNHKFNAPHGNFQRGIPNHDKYMQRRSESILACRENMRQLHDKLGIHSSARAPLVDSTNHPEVIEIESNSLPSIRNEASCQSVTACNGESELFLDEDDDEAYLERIRRNIARFISKVRSPSQIMTPIWRQKSESRASTRHMEPFRKASNI